MSYRKGDKVEAFVDNLWWVAEIVKPANNSDHVSVGFPETHPTEKPINIRASNKLRSWRSDDELIAAADVAAAATGTRSKNAAIAAEAGLLGPENLFTLTSHNAHCSYRVHTRLEGLPKGNARS